MYILELFFNWVISVYTFFLIFSSWTVLIFSRTEFGKRKVYNPDDLSILPSNFALNFKKEILDSLYDAHFFRNKYSFMMRLERNAITTYPIFYLLLYLVSNRIFSDYFTFVKYNFEMYNDGHALFSTDIIVPCRMCSCTSDTFGNYTEYHSYAF
jgi:hypothetical protein